MTHPSPSPLLYPLTRTGPPPSFEDNTLILPMVSVGSVPQLAVDLLLHSPALALEKVARLDHSDCIPFAGPDEGAKGNAISTALEVFQNRAGLTVIQHRSPVFKSREKAFTDRLVAWIRSANFKQVLVLSSIDAAARTDDELSTSVVTLFPAPPRTPALQALSTLYPPFEVRPPPQHLSALSRSDQDSNGIPHIPGGGMTRRLLNAFAAAAAPAAAAQTQAGGDVGALLLFCAEGDNRPDAETLAHLVATCLQIDVEKPLQHPPSWQGVFGAPLDQAMYG
ncbi:uncharacterized protein PFL1_05169 [Pseudozyma flocculosa PF-1]|uniref:Proteasome assembly chaperone 2 n=2 Tax=Pseudozyma flocculosa TaxID=84751 RepID=A0A5C3F7A2_9BASI|nr:uncharacterized protein PFL1_05169 [Pseudozyma flocculosa PF-1]EPQ27246.1 hypothetical protein PFL1_05169 [Pseudozyma flocculosa PF-1]SPO39615.1 related to ADD66 - protein involved in 20S proteasome assembly [Pseudozyma flocculosa]